MSTTHMLVNVWDRITEDLEDNRATSTLTTIDYSKAFNRLEHLPCLKAMARMGASTELIQLVAGFLRERKMTVSVGNMCSELLPVNPGAPQGSVLGSLLFNIGTDDLDCGLDEAGCLPAREVETTPVSTSATLSPLTNKCPFLHETASPIPRNLTQDFEILNVPDLLCHQPTWKDRQISVVLMMRLY